MTLRSRLLPLLCAAAALLTAGCDSGTAGTTGPAASAPAPVRLKAVTPVPRALAKLRPDGSLAMPRGWNIDGSGVTATGKHLVLMAVPPARTRGGAAETWVVDSGTGRVRRFPQVGSGWTANNPVLGGGWLLHVESRQLDGTACGQPASATADCFRWRLYAQPLSSGKPRLIARSAQPGHQSLVPHPLADGRTFVWEQGTTAGKYGVFRWTGGAPRPERLLSRSTRGRLDVDGGALYLTEGTLTPDGGASTRTTYRLGLRSPVQPRRVARFTGSGGFAVHGGRIAYFPRAADETGRIRVLTIGGRTRPVDVGAPVNGFYEVDWITGNRLVTWAISGYALADVRHPATSAGFSPDAVGLGAPRGAGNRLYVVYDPYQFTQSRGAKPTVLAWRHFTP
ncbi:hypothetical protein JK359_06840 [Streptomyces actinomycinicus]|uniref:Uncharacterized protein n=1 Tax=Streptomyces actinomycinicus TaxID=1695166 RepID=A0A937EEV8_9ACTN|nr:hypothetical protein [Streptomyces actinomycinicus]MBL1081697.1 hypothetical protein [Streptomyces actinomycinicus]